MIADIDATLANIESPTAGHHGLDAGALTRPFEIVVEDDHRVFAHQYWSNGEILQEANLTTTVESLVNGQGDSFICFRVPSTAHSTESPALVSYATLAEVQAAQKDAALVTQPLYKLDSHGAVVVDLRGLPEIQITEILP